MIHIYMHSTYSIWTKNIWIQDLMIDLASTFLYNTNLVIKKSNNFWNIIIADNSTFGLQRAYKLR